MALLSPVAAHSYVPSDPVYPCPHAILHVGLLAGVSFVPGVHGSDAPATTPAPNSPIASHTFSAHPLIYHRTCNSFISKTAVCVCVCVCAILVGRRGLDGEVRSPEMEKIDRETDASRAGRI